MKAVAANAFWRSNAGPRLRLQTAVLLCLAAPFAMAWDDPLAPLATSFTESTEQPRSPMRLEVSASSLPRFDNTDGATATSRLDMTWLPPRRSALGLALGLTNAKGPGFGAPYAGSAPIVDLGFHWRYTLDSQYRIDVKAWRRMGPTDAIELVQSREPTYGARVEMQIGRSPQSGFVADRGFLGLQLEGGARITVRRSGGKPMIYYRTKF